MQQHEVYIDINAAMSICIRSGVKIYAVVSGPNKFKVQLDDNGQLQTFDKEFTGKDVATAVHKAWRWYAKKLKIKQDAKQSKESKT